jgi:hypothetical protein
VNRVINRIGGVLHLCVNRKKVDILTENTAGRFMNVRVRVSVALSRGAKNALPPAERAVRNHSTNIASPPSLGGGLQ